MAEPRPAPGYEQSTCDVERYRYAPASVQPTVPPVSGYPDPAYPAPSYAICDDGFKEIVSCMSGWYDRHGYINKLKVLYRDFVTESDKLYAATKVNELFELLCTFGHLSPEDPKVLYDTINVTKPFGLEPEIRMLSINIPDIRTVVISKFTQSRQNLIKVVESLTDNVVKKFSKLYSCDKKSDKWEFVLDLEHRGKICEENMDNFMRNITTHLIIDLNADPLRLRRTGKHNKEFATREPRLNTFTADDQGALMVTGDRLSGDTEDSDTDNSYTDTGDTLTGDRLSGDTEDSDTDNSYTDTGDTLTGDTDAGQSTSTADGQGDIMVTSDRLIGDTDTGDTLTGVTDSGQSISTAKQLAVASSVEREMQTSLKSTDNVCVVNNMFEGNNGSAIGCQFINSNITDSVINIVNNTYQTPVTQVNGDTLPSTTHHQQSNQDEVIKKYLLGIQKQSCRNATRFTPAILNTRYEVDIAHMFTDLDLLKESKKKQDVKPTTLEEVLSIIKSTTACKVLFEGEGGIGKSTLLRYIAYNWATDESDETFKGKIIFLVNISSIDKNETILDAILKQIDLEDFQLETYLSPDPILIKRFIRNHNDEIVLLLDGLDELKDGSESPVSYFKKKKMDSSKVILTSRSENINEFIKASDIHVKVKGFSSINIQKYIKSHFKFVENPLLGDTLIRHQYKHSEVNSMCKNPMLLLLVCTMWEESQQLPENKSDLFKEIFRCIINQYIDKQETNKDKISKYEDIPERFIMAMVVLGKCMYKSLKKNQLSINKAKLKGQDKIVALALKLGFVYKDAPNLKSDFEKIFTAPHKLIVESLVGFYLCKLCQAAQLESEWSEDMKRLLQPLDDNEWKVVRESEHLNTAREFVIGFLGVDAGMFLNHWITNSLSTYRSLMAHFEFVKVEYSTSVKKALFDHMTNMKNLGIRLYINEICKSLREFIHVFSNEDIENENFIHIMQQVYEMSLESLCEIDVETRIKYFFNEMSSEEKGKTIAHILIAISNQSGILEIVSRICGDDDIKYITPRFQKLNFKYDITHLNLCNKISASCIMHLLSTTPQLKYLKCSSDSITGAIMNDWMKECSVQEVKLELKEVYISNNNLYNIDGSSLTSLLVIAPKLSNLSMLYCSLSGDIINDMIRECCSRGVKLELKKLDLRDKNLNNIDGCLFASLLGITSKLESLSMRNGSSLCYVNNNLYGFSCEIRGNNLIDIDSSLLVALLINIKLNKLTLHHCNLSGNIINDMIIECCSRGVKLDLNVLSFVGSDLSNIDGSLFASLLGITCKFVSVSMRNDNSSFEVIYHHNLSISGNNLINIDGSSLATLLINFKLNKLTLNDCSLSGAMIDDMVRECCSRGVKLELEELDISNNNLNNINGSSLASLLVIVPMLNNLNISNCCISGGIINDMTREFISKGVKLKLEEINISDNDFCNINGSSLTSLLVIAPTLSYLTLSSCCLSGVIMNDMMKDCRNRGIKLELDGIDICNNDFCNIDGCLFVSLLRITSKLEFLSMSNGTSSCYFRNHSNNYRYLSIVGNNLIDFDAYSLAALLITFKLNKLKLKHCNVSGVIMNDMIRECCNQKVKLELKDLDISSNDLYNIDGSSLGSLFVIAPKLSNLNMGNCSLSGDIMNDMIREWCSRGVRLELVVLDISDNSLNNISGSLFILLLGTNKLQYLSMKNGSSSFYIRNGFRYRNGNILRDLFISGNNLISIDGSTLAALLITFKLNKLTLNDCSLSAYIMNDMISKCCNTGVKLELQELNIHDNDLCNINNSLFASFLGITCNLESLSVSNGSSCYVIIHRNLDIKGNTLMNIDGSSLAALLITFKLKRLTLSDCNLSGIIVNDMIREFCCRGVKLELKELNISDNDLSNINNSLFVSLLGITCKLNVLMRNVSSSYKVINHHKLNICGNTLINMDGCSLAALSITLNVNSLTLYDCGLSGVIINDMMREYFSRGVKLKLKYFNISDNDLSTIDGSSLATLLVIAPTMSNLIMCNCSLSGVVINDMIRECCNRGVKLQLSEFGVSGNNLSNIEGSSFISLFYIAPKLSKIKMSNCSLSGVIINDMMREYGIQEIRLSLEELSISGDNLSIDGSIFVSLLGITSKLEFFSVSNDSSSCYLRNRHELNISGNNLINIDSSSLAALLIKFKLNRLILNYCSLSGAIMNAMVKECCSQGVELELKELNISGNNLSKIDSSSLASLFVIAPTLSNFNMSNCSLSGSIMNDMVKECCSQGVELKLERLNISGNNLSNIDSSSLTSLFVIAPTLSNLNMSNCTLSGDIMNDMIRECCSQGVKLELETVDISDNNLSKIDGTLYVSLMGISSKPKHLLIRNGSSSCYMYVRNTYECNLHNNDNSLYEITIIGNNCISIDGSSLADLLTKLVKLTLNDCSLSGDIMNDMIRECCSKKVKLELRGLSIRDDNLNNIDCSLLVSLLEIAYNLTYLSMQNRSSLCYVISRDKLCIMGNTLVNIDGSLLVSLIITFKVDEIILNDCSLPGAFMNDMMRECCDRRVKFELKKIDISDNNLRNIDGSLFASLLGITSKLKSLSISNGSSSCNFYTLCERDISGNNLHDLRINGNDLMNIDGSVLATFLISFKLKKLVLNDGSLSGVIMNELMRECCTRGVILELYQFDVSGNNLSNIDGSSMTSFLVIAPTLSNLNMCNCSLSGNIVNNMIRECSSKGVKFKLKEFYISGNNLSNIYGSSLTSLFVIAPTLSILNMSNCSLSGVIMNEMIRECCSRGVKLELMELNISGNNLSNINGSSLSSLLAFTPTLRNFNIKNSSLSFAIKNQVMRECYNRRVKLKL